MRLKGFEMINAAKLSANIMSFALLNVDCTEKTHIEQLVSSIQFDFYAVINLDLRLSIF